MTSILLTGGAGYIGSHTAKALAKSGYQPVVLDNMSAGHRWAVKWGPLVVGEIADRALVRRTLEEFSIQSVIHFAANASVGESMAEPYRYLHDNVKGSLELLEAMREAGAKHIVVSSTCATYGAPQKVPIAETERQAPTNPYGESKLFIERALAWYGHIHGIKAVALRYFNAAGADPDGEIGEDHDPESHIIPLVIQAAMGARPFVQLFGTDYPTPDGSAIRDYIHVDDLADAHMRSLEHLMKGGSSEALNLGTGRGHSVREVIAAVERISGKPVPVRESARRAGDPPELVADASLAEAVIGWKPRYDLDAIVRTAWNWHAARAQPVSVGSEAST